MPGALQVGGAGGGSGGDDVADEGDVKATSQPVHGEDVALLPLHDAQGSRGRHEHPGQRRTGGFGVEDGLERRRLHAGGGEDVDTAGVVVLVEGKEGGGLHHEAFSGVGREAIAVAGGEQNHGDVAGVCARGRVDQHRLHQGHRRQGARDEDDVVGADEAGSEVVGKGGCGGDAQDAGADAQVGTRGHPLSDKVDAVAGGFTLPFAFAFTFTFPFAFTFTLPFAFGGARAGDDVGQEKNGSETEGAGKGHGNSFRHRTTRPVIPPSWAGRRRRGDRRRRPRAPAPARSSDPSRPGSTGPRPDVAGS